MLPKIIVCVLAVAFLFVGVGFVAAPATFTEMATGVGLALRGDSVER